MPAVGVSSWAQRFPVASPRDVQGCVGGTSITRAHVPPSIISGMEAARDGGITP